MMDGPTAAIYDEAAPRWQQSRGTAHDDLGRQFRARAGGGLLVDLGCGPGRYLDQIGDPVVGFDVSAAMLRLASGLGHALARGDLESLPFADATFAGAFARHSYLHVPKSRARSALVDVARALRPGGFFMLSLIEGDYQGRALPGDEFPGRFFAFWKAGELREALLGAGFVDVDVGRISRARGEGDLLATARRPAR